MKDKGSFSGGQVAQIDPEKCSVYGACLRACRFKVAGETVFINENVYRVDTMSCEGCGVCTLVRQFNAVSFITTINGEWYVSETRFGPMSYAKSGTSEENSGKLVSLIRNKRSCRTIRIGYLR